MSVLCRMENKSVAVLGHGRLDHGEVAKSSYLLQIDRFSYLWPDYSRHTTQATRVRATKFVYSAGPCLDVMDGEKECDCGLMRSLGGKARALSTTWPRPPFVLFSTSRRHIPPVTPLSALLDPRRHTPSRGPVSRSILRSRKIIIRSFLVAWQFFSSACVNGLYHTNHLFWVAAELHCCSRTLSPLPAAVPTLHSLHLHTPYASTG